MERELYNALRFALNDRVQFVDEQTAIHNEMLESLDEVYATVVSSPSDEWYRISRVCSVNVGHTIINLFGIDINLVWTCYSSGYADQLLKLSKYCENINKFDEMTHTLRVTIFDSGMKIARQYSNEAITRELKRILWLAKGKEMKSDYIRLLYRARQLAKQITEGSLANITEDEELAAWLIYYSNPAKQQVLVSEHAVDINIFRPFRDKPTCSPYEKYCDLVKQFEIRRKYMDFNTHIPLFTALGYDADNIGKMVEKGLRTFMYEMENVNKREDTSHIIY